MLNASTGARVALPAGTNTAAEETHPSITIDGRRLVFERSDPAAGTVRIIAADLTTSQSADLFNGFEVAQRAPSDPAILPSSSVVYTGGPFVAVSGGGFSIAGRLDRAVQLPRRPVPALDARAAVRLPRQREPPGPGGRRRADRLPGDAHGLPRRARPAPARRHRLVPAREPPDDLREPEHGGEQPGDRRLRSTVGQRRAAAVGAGDIAFRPATTSTFLGPPTVLPAIVNSPADESQPALTADGRYLAFVRHGADGHDRLFIWDSQTQTLLNGKGVDLGAMTSHDVGSVSLYSKLILVRAEHQRERVDQPCS